MTADRAFSAIVIGALVAFIVGVALFVADYGYFWGDDFFGFLLTKRVSLSAALFTPINTQVVPLYRLTMAGLNAAAPLKYGVAVALMAALHAGAVAVLFATLQRLKKSRANLAVAALYGVHVYVGLVFMWCSSGMHRLPYILLTLGAMYLYVRYRDSGRWTTAVGIALCAVGALGYYAKGLLVPLYLVALELCLPSEDRTARGRRLVLSAGLLAALVAIHLAMSTAVREPFTYPPLDLGFHASVQGAMLLVSAYGMFGLAAPFTVAGGVLVTLAWLALVGYTIRRRRTNAGRWVVVLGLITINSLVLSFSDRAGIFREGLPFVLRYYFEQAFGVAVLVGVIVQQVAPAEPETRWLSSPGVRRGAWIAAGVGVAGIAALSYASFARLGPAYYSDMARTRDYVDRLRASIAYLNEAQGTPPRIINGRIPKFVNGWDQLVRRHSQLIELMSLPVAYARRHDADFRISESGDVVPIEKQRKRKRRRHPKR